ncbi:HIT family protein [Syntrophotalea acetylenica]|uniref:HIT family protein n=1 Tax=Syntrophotalea acetylenica TaxID=29542 RepID=UPI0022854BDC|nr:HIT family protein [Syntrophotalea acetylenica]
MSEEPSRYITPAVSGCVFCPREITGRIVASCGTVFAIEDKYPASPGHLLIIPYRHTEDYFSLTTQERQHAEELLRTLKNKIEQEDHSVDGYNVGVNCGEVAGQTVMHAHIHLIPRHQGDTPDPRGGVRGCVPAKMRY